MNAAMIATPQSNEARISFRVLMVTVSVPVGAFGPYSSGIARPGEPMQDALGAPQSVLVLGGASDIALATVEGLADRLDLVVLAGRDVEAMEERAEPFRARGVAVQTVSFDADRPETHAAIIDRVWEDHGDIDVVILAFGRLGEQASLAADPPSAAALVATNFGGAVSAALAVATRLREQRHGTLVVLSSVAGERARADNYVYGSTKAGLDAFAQGLGDDLAATGARVMVVRPGFVRTSMTEGMPDGPMATTADAVAADIVAGLRRGSHTVWSPAKLRPVFGLLKLLPRPIWRRLAARR